MTKRYTITSALPYANGPVHIGHLSGVYIPADIFARYLRAKKQDVLFIGGSDEHGVPITIRAQKEGVTPQEVVDKYHTIIKDSFADFGISFDIYSRTSNKTHNETASEYFKELLDAGKFIEKVSEQFYDEKNNQFLADRYIKGECPKCNNPEAYGDQCEKCGSTLSSDELINPKSALTGETPIKKQTSHWYLPLDEYEAWLKQWILEDNKDWKKNVYGQCKSWLDQGLQARAVTRDLDWGVPVPAENAEGKVLYVWFDAPIGYISASKDWAIENNKDWEPYWKSSDTELVHFIGKDNIVFHCIIFPAMLKASGKYILPKNVPANEFLNLEGNKISTSRNWAVWLHEYLIDFPEQQDALRYTLCANAPETKDNDFTWKDFQTKNNSELVGNLGNFINRVLILTHKYFNGKVPSTNELYEVDKSTIEAIKLAPIAISKSLDQYRFREALEGLMDLSRAGNKYLGDTEPWKLWKENPERVATILNISLQVVANLAILGEPFLPFSSEKLFKTLNSSTRDWASAGNSNLLEVGHQIGEVSLLFEKIEDEAIKFQIDKLENTKVQNLIVQENSKPMVHKEEINFDDFTKLELRVGKIIEAEKVPKTDKLLKLQIDLGKETRTVVSGIAGSYSHEDIVGKQVTLLCNLAPRKIKGIESQGMILMAEHNHQLMFVNPDIEFENGSEIG
jgi:methionyl-tRNA synthetase